MNLPPKAYLLCTMPRSGSTLLCDLLQQTGVAGAPDSFFRPQSMADFAGAWDVPAQRLDAFDQNYIDTALQHGTAGTECFGMRIMWDNIPGLCTRLAALFPQDTTDLKRLQAAFGPLRFIHLSRADKVAEAVSLTIAHQTGLWHRHADGSERERSGPAADPVYDAEMIMQEYQGVTAGDSAWRNWFDAHNIQPHRLNYEAFVAEPVGQLAAILRFLDLNPDAAKSVTPMTSKLATPLSTQWASRFRAEAGIAPMAPPA